MILLNQQTALIVAIIILVSLLVIFFVSFVVYRRMPAPKGCEDMKISEENCSACNNQECQFYKKKEDKE